MKWVQYAIILAVVLVSIGAAYWGTQTIMMILVGTVVGVAGFLALLRYPSLGFILLFLGGMFIPFKGPGGFNASILIVILMIGLWFMDMFVVRRRFEFVKSRVMRPALFMLVVSVIAFAMGQIPWFVFANQAPMDAQIGGFAIYFLLVLAMIMTANVLEEIKWLKGIVWTFVGLGAFYVLGRILNLSFIDRLYEHGVYANSMFWIWLVTLALSQAVFNKDLKYGIRIILFAIVLMAFYVTIIKIRDWSSGWVPSIISAAIIFGLRYKRFALFSIPFIIVIGIYMTQVILSDDTASWTTRLDMWVFVLNLSRVSPLIGLGFANYYWYTPLYPIWGWRVRFNSHSQYVDLFAQTGLAGLICYLWIFFEVGRLGWNLAKKSQLSDGFTYAYSQGILAGICGALMAGFLVDWVLPFAYNIGLDGVRASVLTWIFFGGLIALEKLYLAKQNTISSV